MLSFREITTIFFEYFISLSHCFSLLTSKVCNDYLVFFYRLFYHFAFATVGLRSISSSLFAVFLILERVITISFSWFWFCEVYAVYRCLRLYLFGFLTFAAVFFRAPDVMYVFCSSNCLPPYFPVWLLKRDFIEYLSFRMLASTSFCGRVVKCLIVIMTNLFQCFSSYSNLG